MSEDSELLRRFAANDAGSEAAFAGFVSRRIGFVHGAALRQTSGQAHLAGEITQAVFLAVSKNAAALVVATIATVEVLREKTAAANLAALKNEHTALIKKLGNTQIEAKGYQTKLTNFRRQKAKAAEYAKNPHAPNPVEAGKAFVAQHPEIQAMIVDQRTVQLAAYLYPLSKKLNLTPDQFAELVDLWNKSKMGPSSYDKEIPGFGEIILVAGAVSDSRAWARR